MKETLRHLKHAFTSALSGAQKFAQIKTKDSLGAEAVLSYMGDTPQAGMPVSIVTPEGELPAPSGDYVMEDGSTVKITDGVIMEIVPAAAPVENQNQPPVTQEQKTMEPKAILESITKETRFSEVIKEIVQPMVDEKQKDFDGKFSAQKDEYEKKLKETSDLVAKQDSIIKELFALVEKIGAEPDEKSKQKKKDGRQTTEPAPGSPEAIQAFRKEHGL